MLRHPVESSSIRSVGYDPGAEVLEIEFHHGEIYQYRSVPATVHEGLMAAASKGAFFYENIRERYPYSRVE